MAVGIAAIISGVSAVQESVAGMVGGLICSIIDISYVAFNFLGVFVWWLTDWIRILNDSFMTVTISL